MKFQTKNILVLFLPIFLICCSEENKSTNKNGTKNTVEIPNADSIALHKKTNQEINNKEKTCDELIKAIVLSSNGYDSIVKAVKPFLMEEKIDISVDEFTTEFIRIHISFKNEEGRNATLAWLYLDLKNKKLLDVTIDPDNPISLKFNHSLIDRIFKQCNSFIE